MPLKGEGEPPSMEVGGWGRPAAGKRLGEAAPPPPPETRGPRPEGRLKALLEAAAAAAAAAAPSGPP